MKVTYVQSAYSDLEWIFALHGSKDVYRNWIEWKNKTDWRGFRKCC